MSLAVIGSRKTYPDDFRGLAGAESDDTALKDGAESEDGRHVIVPISDEAWECCCPGRRLFDPFKAVNVLDNMLIALVYLPERINPAASVLNRMALLR